MISCRGLLIRRHTRDLSEFRMSYAMGIYTSVYVRGKNIDMYVPVHV